MWLENFSNLSKIIMILFEIMDSNWDFFFINIGYRC